MRIAAKERFAAFVVGMLVLLLVAGWLVGTHLVRRYRQISLTAWRDPKMVLDWDDIDPSLALPVLAGDSSQAAFRSALDRGDIETAYAALVYAIDLEPVTRCGLLLLLAESKTPDVRRSVRVLCFKMAGWVAVVAPGMPDWARATTLLAVGRGLSRLDASSEALFHLDQAYAIARYSEHLTQAHRRMMLDELVPLYQVLGRGPEAWQPLANQLLTPAVPTGKSARALGEPERPQMLHPSDAMKQAAASRQRMAQTVLRAVAAGSSEISQHQVDDLASVLQHEEQIRQQSYASLVDQGRQIDLARDRVAWAVLKSRVAHKGFGLSILPQWEEQVAEIDAELRAAQDVLYKAIGETSAQRTVLLLQIEHGLLGFYPDWPQAEWAAQLARLKPEQPLHLTARIERQKVFFYLVGEPSS